VPRRLSPSALERYRRCPRRFKFQDVERRPQEESPSVVLATANAIHAALERFYGLPGETRSVEVLHRALKSVWRTHCPESLFASETEEARVGREVLARLSAYAERFDLTVQPLAREQWLSTRLRNGTELFGKLDRVDAVNDNEIRVIDYKTGRPLAEEDLPGESAAQVYLLLAEAAFRKRVESVRFLYLSPASEVCWYPEREDVEVVGERIEQLTATIAAETVFEAVSGAHCRWCPYALACPDRARVELADLVVPRDIAF
jgi:RecB family exonuclease